MIRLVSHLVGEWVLVRSSNSGVWIGELIHAEGDAVRLRRARRIWHWRGALDTSAISQRGLDSGQSTVSVELPERIVLGVCELGPMTDEALATIRSAPERAETRV